jgi:hypothetical protein
MNVISFLRVSLGSSKVQLHDSLGSRHTCACSEAGFSSQNGDRAYGCNTKGQHSVVHFLWAKGLNAKDIHKETFPIYGGKCLLHKVAHNWVKKFSQVCLKIADVEMEVWNWLKQE